MPSRRQFLLAGGAAALLAACGKDGDGGRLPAGSIVVARYRNEILVPGVVRLPVSLMRDATLQPTGPSKLSGTVFDSDGNKVVDVSAVRRDRGTTISYWAFRPTIARPGFYTLRIEGDEGQGSAFEVTEAATNPLPHTGSKLAPFDTPTIADPRGVDPICSHSGGPCPLHDITLTEALGAGTPVAYVVGTPGHCQTGTCQPGLDLVVAAKARLGVSLAAVHADVYADDAATVVSPAMQALGLEFEPVVFLCSADGTIVDHLDGIWDQTELDEVLATLTSSATGGPVS